MLAPLFAGSPPCTSGLSCAVLPKAALTHPASAWLVQSPPVFLALGLVVLLVALFHTQLGQLLGRLIESYVARWRREQVDSSLLWLPPLIGPSQLLMILTLAALVMIGGLSLLAPSFVALLLALPLTALLCRVLLATYTGRYNEHLDRALPAAVGRLGAQLRSGNSFQVALQRVAVDMHAGPLKDEWRFIGERINVPLAEGGGLATPALVVRALAAQTPSTRQAAFLGHLEIALQQTQDVQARRVEAAYLALQDSERQRSTAVTELAQMRYSGMAVGGAGLFMAVYLALTQWERTLSAYSSPLGLVVGPVVLVALLLPIAGGFLLARADDVDY